VRFPWLSNVSTAVTMDSTTLLHFLNNATIETETFQCYMLHFLSNATIKTEMFQLLWRVIYKRESSNERGSWVRERVEVGRYSEHYSVCWDLLE
jgi:hypothetical protein